MENHHPSTVLSMDSSASSSHDELDLEMNRQVVLTRPPDINLPLSAERSPPPQHWNPEHCDILDVGLGTQTYETETFLTVPKVGRKCTKRVDSIWGAWFFFSFYFKPVLNEKSKAKIVRDSNGVSGFDKSDLQLDIFMVQHDMENMYMWCSRNGLRMLWRKHYRGLSNPQCVHGVEVVPSPSLMGLDEDDRKRWMELTGRELNFIIPPEASDYAFQPQQWGRERSFTCQQQRKKDFFTQGNHDDCYLAVNAPDRIPDLEVHPNEPNWLNGFSGVLRNVYGPVTAAKTTYEDEAGYLILISLPFVDLQRVKVSWRNTLTHGIIKVSCTSTSRTPFIKRHNRTFKLTDPSSEHCPPGEFVREIPLSTRIPEDANIEAYYDGPGTVLEILVPKLRVGPEEHEVRVCLRPHHGACASESDAIGVGGFCGQKLVLHHQTRRKYIRKQVESHVPPLRTAVPTETENKGIRHLSLSSSSTHEPLSIPHCFQNQSQSSSGNIVGRFDSVPFIALV
ncbi:UNVERIFIED_CONTAM: hypothetical protein Slati_1672800 [Sesamum latifolium]|uniref:HSP20-like chaperones superfamily protein n=1 Tax=Sesamum latifolium TaxID=2727402 RepID=A0AAW2XBK2_9LAMI